MEIPKKAHNKIALHTRYDGYNKRLVITDIGESVEKLEASHVNGGNVKS